MTVLQEYVPKYRVPFFRKAVQLFDQAGLDLRVAAGINSTSQRDRDDAATLPGMIPLSQHEIQVLGRRITLRETRRATRGSDLVVLEQARRNVDAYKYLLPLPGLPRVALWGHGKDLVKSPSTFDSWLQKRLTVRSDWFFAYTESGRQAVMQMGFDPDRITVLNNTVDTAALRAALDAVTPQQVSAFKTDRGLGSRFFLFIGALDASKRLDFLEESMEHVFDHNPSVSLAIAGAGPLVGQVRAWAARSSGRVRYLGDIRGAEQALALKASEFIVNPGRVGLVAVDSLVSERPIVTTSWPGHAPEVEYLRDGATSVISSDNAISFAEQVLRLLSDTTALLSLRDACRSDSLKFSIDRMAERFLDGALEALTR